MRDIKEDINKYIGVFRKKSSLAALLHASDVLEEIGKPAVPALAEAVNDKDIIPKWGIFMAIDGIGPDAAEAIPALVGSLNDEVLGSSAAMTLGIIGSKAKPVVSALLKALETGKDKRMKVNVIQSLGKIGSRAGNVISALVKAMKDPDSGIRVEAAEALGRIGLNTKAVAFTLSSALQDRNEIVRKRAAWAFGRIRPKPKGSALEPVVSAMRDNAGVSISAVDALSVLNFKLAKYAIPVLIKAREESVDEGDAERKMIASVVLHRIITDVTRETIRLVKEELRNKDPEHRGLAAWVLGEIGRVAESALPALMKRLKDRNQTVRWFAAEAVCKIDRRFAGETVQVFVENLKMPGKYSKLEAIKRLSDIGGSSALEPLALIAENAYDGSVRAAAREAVKKIKKGNRITE
ncbi:hypothetical protein COY52_10600 [Candidatus Desantisbacteria bacterium CG_4_10_14_0_8_um_filter_48_22]|uniref:HEAT repeat domain-containing protein n=1 Tax=Candidatus Desantisbacteria bacterium CG_4_10_14_0_8_um_filter_48_22 TaxID=1974543 RepID=A0A2M7S6B8_9BACT|nr:MAG: hypothetical protein AUJ67_08690 [Candidatus Desantisbacteria bacterium CG1_02_49_89]PIV56650.1 MAG: hypothetical protein COS16_03345 [Candidatus Desantisbacteria bacterium CG02_land_8_20_14_3_00_49_13]PIZ14999.1 MAG: hypothetical protein COY52_10600 [Candidatus Desantisbacteria bacterium CG_4_10_14_0_8_um_filter_48_22]